MRTFLPAILAGLLATPALIAQSLPAATRAQVESGRDIERTRELNSLSESSQSQTHKDSAAIPWRSLSSEAADDPTISARPATHEAVPAARKVAQKADRLAKKGRHADAVMEYRNALAIDPQYYEAENNLALELAASGDETGAEKTLRGLTQSVPEHTLAFTNLATLLLREHRYSEAEAVARQALKQHQFSFKSNYLLGAALVDQGRWSDEAREKLEYAQVKYAEAKVLLGKWPGKAAN